MLTKAGFCRDDILFVLGDMLEKGGTEPETLRLLMDLSATHTVHTLCGNCDDLVVGFVDGREELSWEFLTTICATLAAAAPGADGDGGGPHRGGVHGPGAAARRRRRAVRAGVSLSAGTSHHHRHPEYHLCPRRRTLCGAYGGAGVLALHENDDFLSQDTHLEKWCVVGHWPVTLYREKIPCANPLISREKHIISIDGGCALKRDCQLNLLIIPGGPGGDFSFVAYDDLPDVTALDSQAGSTDSINIRWGKNTVEVLSGGRSSPAAATWRAAGCWTC